MNINKFGESHKYRGHTLPKAAVALVNTAALCGWIVGWQWQQDSAGHAVVTVQVGDSETGERFQYTWHSRATSGRSLRLFGTGLYVPERGHAENRAPSLKAATHRVREVHAQRS
ncbi:hypothetical protein [Streptomyces sp. NPDC007063]|uniref:hypothetical protein n=1 Tax=Streptomyces sp. NPDC007063 TaxID=3364772 RepID=UPI0036B5DF82